jgi:hypothetical protein
LVRRVVVAVVAEGVEDEARIGLVVRLFIIIVHFMVMVIVVAAALACRAKGVFSNLRLLLREM